MKPGEILSADVSLYEGKTKPPELFTERSLITAMKNAGDSLEDKNLKRTLNHTEGIGATRSGIIETLFTRRYCIREKNHILPTELGYGVYDIVKHFKISNPVLTAEWETKLDNIQNGTVSYNIQPTHTKTPYEVSYHESPTEISLIFSALISIAMNALMGKIRTECFAGKSTTLRSKMLLLYNSPMIAAVTAAVTLR